MNTPKAEENVSRSIVRPQISLLIMLLMMTVLAAMSAGLFYASRVTAIREEVSVLTGGRIDGGPTNRMAHISFILFTLCSPLILASVLSTIVGIMRWLEKRRGVAEADSSSR
ncbi:MAG: hypothetical protein AAF664_16065 [Planctomycetota bacterium]